MSDKITVTVTVNADSKKVWDFYHQPEHITQWNFADPSWKCPAATDDVRVGGKLSARMEAKDESFGFDFGGTYTEVIDGKKFILKLDDGREVLTTFEEDGGATKITTVFDAEKQHSAEMQQYGWQAILNNFKKHVEEN